MALAPSTRRASHRFFLCYSHHDRDAAETFIPALKFALASDCHCQEIFRDRDVIQVGDEWDTRIKEALDEAQVFLVLLSARLWSSRYVQEVELPTMFRLASKTNGRRICVVRLESVDAENLSRMEVRCTAGQRFHLGQLQVLPDLPVHKGTRQHQVTSLADAKNLDLHVGDFWKRVADSIVSALSHPAEALVPLAMSTPLGAAAAPPEVTIPAYVHLCNRGREIDAIERALVDTVTGKPHCKRPLVVLSQARPEDLPTEWSYRVRDREVPAILRTKSSNLAAAGAATLPGPATVPSLKTLTGWPLHATAAVDPEVHATRFRGDLKRLLAGDRRASDAELKKARRRQSQPEVWYLDLPDTDDPSAASQAVEGLVLALADLPDGPAAHPLVIQCMIVVDPDYPLTNRPLTQAIAVVLERAQSRGILCFCALGPLSLVGLSETVSWINETEEITRDGIDRMRLQKAALATYRPPDLRLPMAKFVEHGSRWLAGARSF